MKKKAILIITALVSFITGYLIDQKKLGERVFLLTEKDNKNMTNIRIYDSWIQKKQENKSLSLFFERNGFMKVAVYGMSQLGERVTAELRESGISVEYAIDKNAKRISTDIAVVTPDDDLKEVDAVVVTPVFYFDEIESELKSKIRCPIISLEDVIDNI